MVSVMSPAFTSSKIEQRVFAIERHDEERGRCDGRGRLVDVCLAEGGRFLMVAGTVGEELSGR